MKKITTFILALTSFYILQAQQWQFVGNQGTNPGMGKGFNQSLAIDTNGIPYVAYVDLARNYKISVIAYINNTWDTVGNTAISLNQAWNNVKIKINPVTNQPYVLFTDDGLNDNACLLYFNGSIWDTVGTYPFTTSGAIDDYDLTFSQNGIPYVSFREGNNNNGITVMKYDNNTWSVVGNTAFATMSISNNNAAYNDIEISPSGLPYVAFVDNTYNSDRTSVMYFDGNSWQYFGDSLFSSYSSPAFVDMEFDNTGNVYVAFKDNWTTLVRKWSGTQWDTVGVPFPSTENCYYLDLEINSSNEIWLAYTRDNGYSPKPLRVQKFDGSNWGYVGTTNVSPGTAYFTNLEFDKYNLPYVAFQDGDYYDNTSVMKYDFLTSLNNSQTTSINIYPNPVKENIYIKSNTVKNLSYTIYDLTGKIIKQGKYNGTIYTGNFITGIYFIEILLPNGKIKTEKFVKY